MKNVLFIVYYFPPMGGSGVQRPLKFVKYLREFGWNPVVLCPEPGMYSYFDESMLEELKNIGVDIHRVQPKTLFHASPSSTQKQTKPPEFISKVVRRVLRLFMFPDNKKGWIKPAIEKGKILDQQYNFDAIFSTAPPFSNHIIGKELKQEIGKPLALDYRDAWLNNHFMTGLFNWQRKKMYELEKESVKFSDVVIGLDEQMLKQMKSSYPELKSTKVIPHGYDPEDFNEDIPSTLQYKKDKLNFLYSGIFYESNQPDVFLKALQLSIKNQSVRREDIHLHFQGGLDSRIRKLVKNLGFEELVTDYGYLSHEQAVANLKRADVLWMISNFQASFKQVKSGKLFEYFGAKKPILGITQEGAEADLLKSYGAGYFAKVNDIEHIAKVIAEIYKVWKRGEDSNINTSFVKKLNRKSLTKKLAEIFNEISADI